MTQADPGPTGRAPDPEVATGVQRADEKSSTGEGIVDFLKELPVLIIVAFGLAILIKTFFLQAFFIPSGSMEDTLQQGDRVFVSKLSYRFSEPRRGDVIVFVSPNAPERQDRGPVGNFFRSLREGLGLAPTELDLIKRVVAVGGDVVQGKEGSLYVNGDPVEEPYLKEQGVIGDFGPVDVEDGEVFMMGDNRANSQDSRFFGPVEESAIVGRAFVRIWPASRMGILRRLDQP